MIITPGEITTGDYIVVFEEICNVKIRKVTTLFGSDTGQYEEVDEKIQITYPWLKGIPFKVIGVALPIIAARNLVPPSKEKPLASTLFLDSRHLRFLKVDETYAKEYVQAEVELRNLNQELNAGATQHISLTR